MDIKYKIPPTKLGLYLWMRDIKLSEFKQYLPFTDSYLSQILWGVRKDNNALIKIAEALNINPEEIIED